MSYLRDAFEEAEEGEQFVITRYRRANVNLRTQLLRIIRKAGLESWPKLFQNLRATRQTELCQRFPEHVVCDWIGNSPSVAREHYLRTTDKHFEQAIRPNGVTLEAAQNPTQHNAAKSRKAPQTVLTGYQESPFLPLNAALCGLVQGHQVPPRGVELKFTKL